MTPAQLFDTGYASAVISECGTYRYNLQRRWDQRPLLGWVMLNGSKADGLKNDPTIRRCIGFAKAWGYGGIDVRNAYGMRSTNPNNLWTHPDPVGPENDGWLALCHEQPLTILAWGANIEKTRERVISRLLWDGYVNGGGRLAVLGWTKAHHPKHPLYVPAATEPEFCDEAELFGSAS